MVRVRAEKGFPARCRYSFRAPFSHGATVQVPAGLVMELDEKEGARARLAKPLPQAEWEEVFAPDVVGSGRFEGYDLVLDSGDVDRHCRETQATPVGPAELSRIDALTGCMMGTAVGDSLGLPFEGLSPRRMDAWKAFPLRQRLIPGHGLLSDDTEHAAAVAQALARSGGDPTRFLRSLAWGLRWWLLSLPPAIGFGTLRALSRLLVGVSPQRSGVDSAGNGPLMRAPILGVFASEDPEGMAALVRASTRITHRDPRAQRAAGIVARAAAESAAGAVDPARFLEEIDPGDDAELVAVVESVRQALAAGWATRDLAASRGWQRGVPGYCYATLEVVLHAWLSHLGDFEAAMTAVVVCGGDTDTTGAILGGIVGAGVGPKGIPDRWWGRIVDWPRSRSWILQLSRELAWTQLARLPRQPVAAPLPFTLARNLVFLPVVLGHGLRRLLPPW